MREFPVYLDSRWGLGDIVLPIPDRPPDNGGQPHSLVEHSRTTSQNMLSA